MLLRRISKHFEDQNWFAVGLDFLIVVVGVFIGIQVANWNEARALNAQEHAYLVQLKDEIRDNQQSIEYQMAFVETLVSGGEQGLEFLQSDGDCGDDCAEILIGFFHASQVWGTGYSTGVYDDATALGFPRKAASREALQSFQDTIRGWNIVNLDSPAYRERIRGHFDTKASKILWATCYGIGMGRLETLSHACEPALNDIDLAPMMRQIHADPELKNQLQFWVGQNIFALKEYPSFLEKAEDAISALDRDLGTTP